MATIVKCPTAKRNGNGGSKMAEVIGLLPKIRPGQAVQYEGNATVAFSAVTAVNAYVGEPRFRAFKATDGKTYVTVNG